jgi:hypothetical protein
MDLIISANGSVRCIYAEAIDLAQLGRITIRRASFVEPTSGGQWIASLQPSGGPDLGPFTARSAALAAEQAWLLAHWLAIPAALPRTVVTQLSQELNHENPFHQQ